MAGTRAADADLEVGAVAGNGQGKAQGKGPSPPSGHDAGPAQTPTRITCTPTYSQF